MSTVFKQRPHACFQSLVERELHPLCQAIIVIPVRNEEERLVSTLDSLRLQVDLQDRPLHFDRYEVLLLLNNCDDRSGVVAARYGREHPRLRLHIAECVLRSEEAHVGTARHMLMDIACARLERNVEINRYSPHAILSTDADTTVGTDWIVRNLAEIEKGAEVVGGVIHLLPSELELLEEPIRAAYRHDRRLQRLIARLESILDPDPADPWPRHLEHFGASLACTCDIYRLSGGLPPVNPLEDIAFIHALRRVGARIRHSPDVRVYTSARLKGRVQIGFSGRLRYWQREAAKNVAERVDSAEWHYHRFSMIARLRRLNECEGTPSLKFLPSVWHDLIRGLHAQRLPTALFLQMLDSDALIEESFRANREIARHAEIPQTLDRLTAMIQHLLSAQVHPVDIYHGGNDGAAATRSDPSNTHAPHLL